ncbi:MAG: V-type ATP synthase subunit I [Candidatus Eisenbacteria bacterium]
MAVSRMRKIQILAHRSVKADVVAALREGGVLHVAEVTADVESAAGVARRDRERELSSRLSNLEYLRTYLKPHAPKKKPMEAMFNPKLLLSGAELEGIVGSFDVDSRYGRVSGIEADVRSGEAEIARKESLAAELGHWDGLGMRVEDIGDTRLARVSLLAVEASEYRGLSDELAADVARAGLFEVSRSGASVFAVAIFLKEDEGTVAPIVKRHGARAVDLSGATGTPGEAAARLLAEADALRSRIEELEGEAAAAAQEYDRLLAVLDETAEDLAKVSVEERFGETRETILVEGWIRSRDEEALAVRLADVSPAIHVVARDPASDDEVPIDLRNNGAVSPFEFVTTLYGRPVYWEYDPTPLLAPFFVLFFGLCVSDGGYGLILAVLTFLMMRKMQPGGGRKLMQLLFMGGVATAAVGAVTGGWFGIEAANLPPWLNVLRIRLRSGEYFNPLEHPMHMLDFVFLLGIVQIFTGLAIRMVADFKERRWADGVLDQFAWIVFLSFLAPLGADFILGKEIPAGVMSVARTGAMITGLIVVATGARKNPNPVMKVLGGVLKLYDVVGYFGDVLSYARLLALGLATGAIAMAINGVADMAGGIPFVGVVAMVVVLIGGHLFNLAVNCLGGFVHSARLQYLEYFSKFFTGGGREFVPFKDARRYSVIRD